MILSSSIYPKIRAGEYLLDDKFWPKYVGFRVDLPEINH